MRLSKISTVLTLAVFRTRLILPLTTATINTAFLSRTCSYKFFWRFAWNKHATEKLPTKITWFEFWLVGIKNIKPKVYEVVGSQ